MTPDTNGSHPAQHALNFAFSQPVPNDTVVMIGDLGSHQTEGAKPRSGPAQYTFAFTLGGRSADTSGWRFQVVDPLGADGRSDPGDLIANPVDNDYEITQDNGVVRVTVNRANAEGATDHFPNLMLLIETRRGTFDNMAESSTSVEADAFHVAFAHPLCPAAVRP
ncbi:MAG: hypothetical protein WCP34_16420 [Pseudomonadota bacterium]